MYFRSDTYICKHCKENFESTRRDAAFCSSKCRTAHHRLMKKREAAHVAILETWEDEAKGAYLAIGEESADVADEIKDIFGKDPRSAEQAAVMAYEMMGKVQRRLEREIVGRDLEIERLRVSADKLQELKSYIQQI